jgi:hypothetical protein
LLAFNPAHNLIRIENQFAAGPGAEMRETFGYPRIPNAPRRAANKAGDLPNIDCFAESGLGT